MGSRGQSAVIRESSGAYRNALENAEASIRSDPVETAFCLDKDGNELFRESQGAVSYVMLSPDQTTKMKDANFTHNHPSGTTFSTEDISLCVKTEAASFRATSTLTDYELARMKGSYPNRANFANDYQAAQDAAKRITDKEFAGIEAAHNNGQITDEQFQKECDRLNGVLASERDKWLRKNAKRYGYRYTVTRR